MAIVKSIQKNKKIIIGILISCIILVLLCFILYCEDESILNLIRKENSNNTHKETLSEISSESQDTITYINVTAEKLYKDYNENSVGARLKYENQYVAVMGKIISINDKTIHSDTNVILGTAEETKFEKNNDGSFKITSIVRNIDYVYCYFNPENEESLISLKKEQEVTIKGFCEGYTDNKIIITNCNVK